MDAAEGHYSDPYRITETYHRRSFLLFVLTHQRLNLMALHFLLKDLIN